MTMNAPSKDVADYLVSESVGTLGGTSGWSINYSKEPAAPNTTVTIYDTGGPASDIDNDYYEVTIQVRVRAAGYDAAYTKAEQIKNLLIDPSPIIQNNTRYIGFWVTSDIALLQYDQNDRAILVFSLFCIRQDEVV